MVVASVVLNILLGFIVYRSNTKSSTTRLYGLLSLVMSGWVVVHYLSFRPELFDNTLFLIRLSLCLATLMNAFFFLFTATFPRERVQLSTWKKGALLWLTLVVMMLTMSPYVFVQSTVTNGFPSPIPGPGIGFFGLYAFSINLLSVLMLVRRSRTVSGIEKAQMRIVIYGVTAMFGAIIATVLLPVALFHTTFFVPFLPFYTLIFLTTTSYAIVKFRLFDLRVAATEALSVSIWIILFAKIFTARNTQEGILDGFILLATIAFGVLLIRSVRNEISQRQKLELLSHDLELANAKLTELDKMKSQFLSFASHQLRSPLTTIKWQSQLMLDGSVGALPEKAAETARAIEESSDRMLELVSEFLNLRKLEEGKMEYTFEPTDVAELVSGVVTALKPLAEHKGLTLTYVNHASKTLCSIDRQKFMQVVQNLIDNSIKYTDAGSVRVSVEDVSAGKVAILVSDTGHGIDPAIIATLFEQFVRDKNDAKKIEGTGLGLYIAKQMMDAHHGSVRADSQGLGKGSTFTIELPTL